MISIYLSDFSRKIEYLFHGNKDAIKIHLFFCKIVKKYPQLHVHVLLSSIICIIRGR